MNEKQIASLMDFGLSINQARVYASLITFKSLTVKEISETTKLHMQDVYKIIPKLQKMGLITKSLNRPCTIQIIPIKNALLKLVEEEKAKALQKAKTLEKKIETINNQKNSELQISEYQVFVIPEGKALNTKADSVFNNKLNNYDLVTTWKYFLEDAAPYLKPALKRIGNDARIRILVSCSRSPEDDCFERVEHALKDIATKDRRFSGRILIKHTKSVFALLNNVDLWIPTSSPEGDIIINNCSDVANLANETFEYFWNDPLTKTIIEINPQLKRRKNNNKIK